MSRSKSTEPKLYKRGVNGCYYFRRLINKTDMAINTGKYTLPEAEAFRKNYIDSEIAARVGIQNGDSVFKVANTIVKTVTGTGVERVSLEEAYSIWLTHNTDFKDNSEKYQGQMKLYYQRFVRWCTGKNIKYMDEVSAQIALDYTSFLNTKGMYCTTYNENIKLLSRVFAAVGVLRNLPNSNPFCKDVARRKKKPHISEASHRPLEKDMLDAVMKAAMEEGEDWFDLFLLASQTGMRLADAALFRWSSVSKDVIEYVPQKTKRHGIKPRVPISRALACMFERRKAKEISSAYVNSNIAEAYLANKVSPKAKLIFEKALGKENTQLQKDGVRRMRNGCLYSFHSFRTTFMSLLAMKQVPYRDAMKMLGWESYDTMMIYEKMLEKGSREMDIRNQKVLSDISELQIGTPVIEPEPRSLRPTKEAMEKLVRVYSNCDIGRIYNISNVAVKKWLDKFGLVRPRHIITGGIDEALILQIREELKVA